MHEINAIKMTYIFLGKMFYTLPVVIL